MRMDSKTEFIQTGRIIRQDNTLVMAVNIFNSLQQKRSHFYVHHNSIFDNEFQMKSDAFNSERFLFWTILETCSLFTKCHRNKTAATHWNFSINRKYRNKCIANFQYGWVLNKIFFPEWNVQLSTIMLYDLWFCRLQTRSVIGLLIVKWQLWLDEVFPDKASNHRND